MWNTRTESDDLATMPDSATRGAAELATAHASVIAFACTSGSFIGGVSGEETLRARLLEAGGVPVVTTSGAFIEALRALNVTNVVVATPYPDPINDSERDFIRTNGIAVASIGGLGISESVKIGHCTPQQAFDLAVELDTPEADGVFISCTNFRSFEIIDRLEQKLGKPVVSSNQATFWKSLKLLGHTDPVPGIGSLLTSS
jgi:maleate isomerase